MNKKRVLIMDSGKHICTIHIVIDPERLNLVDRMPVNFNGEVLDVVYVVGMDYGIIVPTQIKSMYFYDENIH